MSLTRRTFLATTLAAAALSGSGARAAEKVSTITIDWATYNPVSLLLRDRGLLEKEFAGDGISIQWVQSAGSNKALEFLNAGSIDFGSTAGAASLLGRINGNPIKSIYVFSRPEWTALVERADEKLGSVAELKGKAVAVTRGTDPHIFLVRALAEAGLTEKDIRIIPLQHADGKTALLRGDVEAWAGLDPMMASAEIEADAKLFYRKPEANTWGVLNTREEFLSAHPELVARVLKTYEVARKAALDDSKAVKAALVAATKLPDTVIARQLERTSLSYSTIGPDQAATITEAGKALQSAGVIKADVDVKQTVVDLIDTRFKL